MRSIIRWRRSSVAVLSTLAISGAALAIAGSPAAARSVDPAPASRPAATTAQGATGSTARISKEAWAAGHAKYGTRATAAQALAAYWTPARMRAAKPIEDLPQYQAAVRKFQRSGKSASKPDRVGPAQSVAPSGKIGPAVTGTSRAANPNFVYWHPTARTTGKVFFDTPFGRGAQCSASIINSEGRDTVWTAGHCVHGGAGAGWYWNWTFIPSYDIDLGNPRPYGTWGAVQLWTRTAWVTGSDFSQDIAVAIMGTLGGWHIVDYLGGQGLRVNFGVPQWQNSFGYPAEPPFSGGHLWQCWGWSGWEIGGATHQIPCDMNRGSSGGPWLQAWDGNWGYLNGVNSRVDRLPGPTLMKSAYFDNDAWDLYNATRNL